MKGLLLYTPEDAARSRWFAGHLADCARARGMELTLVTVTGPDAVQADAPLPDFVVNRARFAALSRRFERRGVRCFNRAAETETGNDKWQTDRLCRRLGLPVMDTWLYRAGEPLPEDAPFPCVVKSLAGHGGSEIFWAGTPQEAVRLAAGLPGDCLLQRPAARLGLDVRVYLMGDTPLAAVQRTSSGDFRSNFSLGGQAALVPLERPLREMALTVQRALEADYIGVDFLCDGTRWVVNEIEDAVGARMLYRLTALDAGELFIRHIAETMGAI